MYFFRKEWYVWLLIFSTIVQLKTILGIQTVFGVTVLIIWSIQHNSLWKTSPSKFRTFKSEVKRVTDDKVILRSEGEFLALQSR